MDDRLALRRRRVLDQGRQVAAALEKLMNGLDVRLEQLGAGFDLQKGRDERARLRAWLDRIDRVAKSFDAGTYGACVDCRAAIEDAVLEQTPWADRCPPCLRRFLGAGG